MRTKVQRLTAALVLLFLCAAPNSAHAVGGMLTFVLPSDEPQIVHLFRSRDHGLRSATLALTLRNNSAYDSDLTIAYVAPGVKAALPASPDRGTGIALSATSGVLPKAQPYGVVSFSVTFSAPDNTTLTAIDGDLVASAPEDAQVQPATLHVRVDATGPVQWTDVVIDPAKVTLHATRLLPFGIGDWVLPWSRPRAMVHLRSVDPAQDAQHLRARAEQATGGDVGLARVASDRGDLLSVALHNDFAAAADGSTVATLAAKGVGWAGKYDGSFALDATAKSPHNLAVTVNVQDWFIWPWVFIFLGAVLAWRTVLYEDQRRSKELLRERLKELANGYRDLMRLPDGRSPAADARLPYSLHGILPLGEDATDWHCPHVDALTYAERLYCDIDAPTQEGLNSVRDNIAKIGDMLGLAKQIKDAAAGLRDAARQIGALAPQPPHVSSGVVARTPAIMDEINLILTGLEPLGNRNEAQDRSSAMQNQTDAVALWRHAWQLYRAAADLYDTLVGAAERSMSDPDRAALHASDPRAICAVYLWPAKNLAELQQADVLARLREANRVLLALADRYQQALTSATLQARTIGVMTITLPSAFTAPPQPRADERTAAQILVSVQRHDLRDFLIAFGLTTLAFLLTIYPDKNFGSVWQYVAAFTAGATGQVAIAWKLLPWYRSYNAKSAATAT